MLADLSVFFFFNDTATTEIYTLSLHDALPISKMSAGVSGSSRLNRFSAKFSLAPGNQRAPGMASGFWSTASACRLDRKSTRLNSSHANISYAVFCLKKKNKQI